MKKNRINNEEKFYRLEYKVFKAFSLFRASLSLTEVTEKPFKKNKSLNFYVRNALILQKDFLI